MSCQLAKPAANSPNLLNLTLQAEKAAVRGAPEEAKMSEEPFCEHL